MSLVSFYQISNSSTSPKILPTPAGFYFDPTVVPSLVPTQLLDVPSLHIHNHQQNHHFNPNGVAANFQKDVISPQSNINFTLQLHMVSPRTASTATRLFFLLLEQLGILNTLLSSVHLLYPIQHFTPIVIHLHTTFLKLTIVHLKQKNKKPFY